MALHFRNKEMERLVRKLAERRRIPLTDAVTIAVQNELRKDDDTLSLWERLKPVRDEVAARPSTGLEADKAFFDELSGEP